LAAAGAAGCKAKEDAFYRTIYPCAPDAGANSCGTTRAGAPMVCFAASRLGSIDYCAESCDPEGSSDQFTCLGAARVQVCNPADSPFGCSEGFECHDAGSGRGMCLPPCPAGDQCSAIGSTFSALPDAGPPDVDASQKIDDVISCVVGKVPCPVPSNGKPLMCVPSSALGGLDFCAEQCDPAQPPADPDNFACSDMGALLRRCQPNGQDAAAGCPAGLNCFRTDLLGNTGLCMRMPVCDRNGGCMPNSPYSKCSATLLGDTSSTASSFLQLDHLNCVHPDCFALQSNCGDLEGCLATQYGSPLADICVPTCDTKQHCPPNFSCATTSSGAGSLRLCLPGVPGERCDGAHCIIGACEDTGANFSVCTFPCSDDTSCRVLSTETDPFICVEGGGQRHCVTPQTFAGPNCMTLDQCDVAHNEFCSFYDLFGRTSGHGDCRLRCNPDGTCDPRGGMAFACLQNGQGGCFPGILGVPCTQQSECINGLTCQDVPPEPEVPAASSRFCTLPCSVDGGTDADGDHFCTDQLTVARNGYCNGGICRLVRAPGLPCDRDAQCQSHLCDIVNGMCAPLAGIPSR